MLKVVQIQAKDKLNQDQIAHNTWIQLIDPSKAELEKIAKDYSIPFALLKKYQSGKCGTTIERSDNLFAFILELPLEIVKSNPQKQAPYETNKLAFIVCNDVVITISKTELAIFDHILSHQYELNKETNTAEFVFHIMETINHHFTISLDKIDEIVNDVEHRLQISISNKQVFELLNNNKSYLSFVRAFKHNEAVLKELEIKRLFNSNQKTDLQLNNLVIATQQLKNRAEIYNANLRNLMDAYSAAIENNLSLAVQYLTVFVTIAAIPSAIAGIYGMNSPLPIQEEPYALTLIAVVTFAIALIAIIFFKIRRYI